MIWWTRSSGNWRVGSSSLISLARKSGHAVAGYEKVKDWLSKEEALILIQAVDGSGRGKSKLSTPHFGHYIGWLTADELGMAFGRQTVIHAALASGGLAQRVVEEAKRLRGVRKTDGGKGRFGRIKSFMSDTDGKKTLGLRGGSRPGNVKQSFSHGRTKNVVVETKRKRVVVPKPGAKASANPEAQAPPRRVIRRGVRRESPMPRWIAV